MTRLVVVAGASSTSGKAVSDALTAAGHTVVVVGSSAGRLESIEAAARYECDLTVAAAVNELAARIRTDWGPSDGLIHLVGGWRAGQTDDDFAWLESHVLTTLRNTSRAFRADLGASDAGRLAIVSSTSVDQPTWTNANYATVKAAAETWMSALASGWAKGGTAAAVTFVVTSLGRSGTPESVLADRVVALWAQQAGDLNGRRILLTT